MKPRILVPELGRHNIDLERSAQRLVRANSYRDLSTICIIPILSTKCRACGTRAASPPPRVISSWFSLMAPMNQKFIRLMPENMEVGEAYSTTIEMILANPELAKWKYILTLEHDNMPPADGLLKLYESIEGQVDGKKYDAVGGLYWTKGEGGQPMIYGDPTVMPMNFIPQVPKPNQIQPCNGLGMGFTLFRMSMFRDPKLTKPWFQTKQELIPGQGVSAFTQDLYFFNNARKFGYKFASDNRVLVGHYSTEDDIIW